MDFTLGSVDIQAGFPLDVTLLAVGVLAAYWGMVRRHGEVMASPGRPAVTRREVAFFTSGVVVFWLSDGWPLAPMSEHLFSFHMVQHVLQAFVIPPLLLLGLPEWAGDVLLRNDRVRAVTRWLARPLIAGVLFNLVFLVTHLPGVIELQVRSDLFHAADHLVLIGSALVMWLPVFSPFPGIVRRMQPLGQMLYLFLMTLLPTIPSAFLIFGEVPLYPVYGSVAQPWNLGLINDMRVGGLIMKLGGGFLLWGIIAVKFFRWAADNERNDRAARPSISTTPTQGPA